MYDTLNREAEAVRGLQEFTDAEFNNWVTIREIKEGIQRAKFDVERLGLLKVQKHKPKNLTVLIRYLLLKMYQELHWRSDVVSVKVGKFTGSNYYHEGKFYLNKFKTSRKFKQRGLLPLVYTPSRSLKALLRKYLAVREAQELDHDYLVFNQKMKPIPRSTFFEIMSRATFQYVGKKLGTSALRHIYATHFLAQNPSLREKKKFLREMMQLQLETFESYARRGDDGKLVSKP